MTDASSHWDQLHKNPRFRPQYPSDHVVRFLMGSRPLLENGGARFLDIGVGAGRHCALATDLGFEPYGGLILRSSACSMRVSGAARRLHETVDEYRFGKGKKLSHNTFQLDIADTNELGTVQHFIAAEDINLYFSAFSHITFEKTETTSANCTRLDSDWLNAP
jgi:hypothetical protein